MNQNSHGFLFFFFILFIFLLFSQSASALIFPPAKQGNFAGLEETHNKLSHDMVQEDSWLDFPHILGGTEKEEIEEWEKRRMMLEAHLDYVYTQNEKP